jgi:hypothetical protein
MQRRQPSASPTTHLTIACAVISLACAGVSTYCLYESWQVSSATRQIRENLNRFAERMNAAGLAKPREKSR